MGFSKINETIKCDVLVVGCGPGGSGAAEEAAKNGAKTVVIDKRWGIGSPIRCGECMDPSLLATFGVEVEPGIIMERQAGTVFNINRKMRIVNTMDIWKSVTVDRRALDKFFAMEAARAGATVMAWTELVDMEFDGDTAVRAVVKCEDRMITIEPKVVIAADGTYTTVGQFQKRRVLDNWEVGKTISFEMSGLNLTHPNMIQMFFDDMTGFGYGYIIPKSKDTANVGLGRMGLEKPPWKELQELLDNHPIIAPQVKIGGVIELKSGETPITGPVLELKRGNVLYVGNAAGQNLSHVGEGAIPSHVCGRDAGTAAAKAAISNNPEELSEYGKRLDAGIGPLLKECARIRDIVFKYWQMDIPLEDKLLMGGLVISEAVPPEEKFAESLRGKKMPELKEAIMAQARKDGKADKLQISLL